MKPVITPGTFSQARVLAAGLALSFMLGLTACGGGGSSTPPQAGGGAPPPPPGGGGGGGGAVKGFIFVANPNSGNLSSYGYDTSTGTISSLINAQSPATFQSSANHINIGVDTTNGLVFMGTHGTSTNSNSGWSYLYNSTGVMSGGQSSSMAVAAGTTPTGAGFDTLNHFAISISKTSTTHNINSYSYNSTGKVSATGSPSSVTGQIVTADLAHHLIFAFNGTTVSSYGMPADTINATANNSVTVSALSGNTGVDNAIDATNGIVFLFINNTGGSSIVPIPYDTGTGMLKTPAAATTFASTNIRGSCNSGSTNSQGVDPANKLLFVSDNSNGYFGMYSYDATTGAIGSSTLWMNSQNISPGYCASVDTGNRIMFFLTNSTPTSPYQVSSFTYPAAGNGITPVNTVSGVTSGATFQEVMAINH